MKHLFFTLILHAFCYAIQAQTLEFGTFSSWSGENAHISYTGGNAFGQFNGPNSKMLNGGIDGKILSIKESISRFKTRDAKFVVYPNPAIDFVKISCSNQGITNQLSLLDLNGKKINTYSFVQQLIIDIRAYPPGMYLLKLNDKIEKLLIR